jgi:ATP-dependent Clp protease ATP-binding subunit ClpC
MSERYTETSRRVIFFARYEARQHGSTSIEPEHLFLGLLRESRDLFETLSRHQSEISPEFLRSQIEERMVFEERTPRNSDLVMSDEVADIFSAAIEESDRNGDGSVGPIEILLALASSTDNLASEILRQNGLNASMLSRAFGRNTGEDSKGVGIPMSQFLVDLSIQASEGKLDPLIGRDDEVERIVEVICRRTKNNVILIGEAGVGKTAIVEGIAQKIARGDVPAFLLKKKLMTLDLPAMVAGTKYRGQFEERLKTVVAELKNNPDAIVFIDEIHTLVGAGSAEGSLDAANILKPALARKEIQCIGATTPAEFRKSIEKDRALERRFQPIRLDAPGEDEAIRIVAGLAPRYEKFHSVKFTDDALISSVKLTNRYLPDRFLPDKAIDAIDEAGARAKLGKSGKTIGRKEIEDVVARWTGIPLDSIQGEERERLLSMEKVLGERVIAQEKAISVLSKALRRSRAGIGDPDRPVGSFLFLGPTGVGKTEAAKGLAQFLFGSEKALIRFDMSEFVEKHSVAKLIGSPPGYVGFEEGGRLTEQLRRRPYSVVLFDEIEKSHPDVWNVLLQIFDEGTVTDANGVVADCRNAVFIMTSNIGARDLGKGVPLGFHRDSSDSSRKDDERVLVELRKIMSPELLGRIDEMVVFTSLDEDSLMEILSAQIQKLAERIEKQGFVLKISGKAKSFILNTSCIDGSKGAREIKGTLRRLIEDPLAELLLSPKASSVKSISIDLKGGRLFFKAI